MSLQVNRRPTKRAPDAGEQGDNASRVVYLDAGKRVDISRFSEEQLRVTVEEIRKNQKFQERALTIMNGLQSTNGVVTASRCIDWVAQKRKPLYSKRGIPPTITPGHLEQLLGD